jgi:hypothetical protein
MAGISQEIQTDEVLPLLARNASLLGYTEGKQTEFLALLNRYVQLARELRALADPNGNIHISGCDDAGRLVEVLGYKFRGSCGQRNAGLAAANPERAFLTIDSGFPLTKLEQALQQNAPFTYSFPATRVPIVFREKDWTTVANWNKKSGESLVDALLHDQELDRFYWAIASCNQETRSALSESPGLRALLPFAAILNLYGSGINIHSGHMVVPGSDKAWEDLVGAGTNAPGEFVTHLLSRDRGWMAAYFDAFSRLPQAQQVHLSEGTRLKRLYDAFHSTAPHVGAADGVFPKNAELLVLLTSLRWEANGDPEIREGLGVWQEILSRKGKSSGMHMWPKRGRSYESPERLLELLVASSNLPVESGPMQIFLMLEAIDDGKPAGQRLSDGTELLVANRLAQFNDWFSIFAEFPALDDKSIAHFVSAADRVDGISNQALRANALGALQANIGLWQIFVRQGQIPKENLNASWQDAVEPFTQVSSSVQVFEAARSSLKSLVKAAAGNANVSQDTVVELLAGPVQASEDGRRVHKELSDRIRAVLDDQRLVSLDTLFGLYDGLTDMAKGSAVGSSLLPLAGDLREFEMPRPIFTGTEKSEWSPLVYTSRHAELQARTDLTKILRSPASPSQLESARGQLTPFLRDTLVGLNYAYYEPPGSETLHHNPLFVRSHDFTSITIQGVQEFWGTPDLIGVGATAGGGAYLVGSLADLPYALAVTEQEFIAPRNVQALIWQEAVPDLIVDATLPRWWTISRDELHCVALYQRAGEELLAGAAGNADLEAKVVGILSDRMTPDRLEGTERAMQSPADADALVSQAIPADSFYLAAEFRRRYPDQAAMWGPAGRELDDLARRDPPDTSPERLSSDFGTPHAALVPSNSRALLNLKPFPAFEGKASRLLAESWESNNLYWARLADEMGYSPVMLNVLVPMLTRHMIANIFASNIDDWPAFSRAMRETGDEFRQGKIVLQASASVVNRQ